VASVCNIYGRNTVAVYRSGLRKFLSLRRRDPFLSPKKGRCGRNQLHRAASAAGIA